MTSCPTNALLTPSVEVSSEDSVCAFRIPDYSCALQKNPEPRPKHLAIPKRNMIHRLSLVVTMFFLAFDGTTVPATASNLTVRTTAYTHTESDHIRYRNKNAIGTTLKYGKVRSAAADWSIFPLGTKFRIEGDPSIYVIDDYGSALVGKRTIDLYKPTRRAMNTWGTRHVDIEIVEWGSFQKSLTVLKPRVRYKHVRRMVARLRQKV